MDKLEGRLHSAVMDISGAPLYHGGSTQANPPICAQDLPRPKPCDWNNLRQTITRLYLEENLKLSEVRDKLEKQYGFRATPKMYKTRLKAWGIEKNLKRADVELCTHTIQREDARNAGEVRIIIRGRPVSLASVLRHAKRRKHTLQGLAAAASAPTELHPHSYCRIERFLFHVDNWYSYSLINHVWIIDLDRSKLVPSTTINLSTLDTVTQIYIDIFVSIAHGDLVGYEPLEDVQMCRAQECEDILVKDMYPMCLASLLQILYWLDTPRLQQVAARMIVRWINCAVLDQNPANIKIDLLRCLKTAKDLNAEELYLKYIELIAKRHSHLLDASALECHYFRSILDDNNPTATRHRAIELYSGEIDLALTTFNTMYTSLSSPTKSEVDHLLNIVKTTLIPLACYQQAWEICEWILSPHSPCRESIDLACWIGNEAYRLSAEIASKFDDRDNEADILIRWDTMLMGHGGFYISEVLAHHLRLETQLCDLGEKFYDMAEYVSERKAELYDRLLGLNLQEELELIEKAREKRLQKYCGRQEDFTCMKPVVLDEEWQQWVTFEVDTPADGRVDLLGA